MDQVSLINLQRSSVLFAFILCGCASFREHPLVIPKETNIACRGDTCCYPSDKGTMMCVSSDALHSMIICVKVIEK